MKSQKISFYKCLAIVAIILFCDQFLKVYIKLNFPLTIYGQDPIFDMGWFKPVSYTHLRAHETR